MKWDDALATSGHYDLVHISYHFPTYLQSFSLLVIHNKYNEISFQFSTFESIFTQSLQTTMIADMTFAQFVVEPITQWCAGYKNTTRQIKYWHS